MRTVLRNLQSWDRRGGFGSKLVAKIHAELRKGAGEVAGAQLTDGEAASVVFVYKEYLDASSSASEEIPTGAKAKMLGAILEGLPKDFPDLGRVPAVLGMLDTIVFSGGTARAP